MRLLAILSPDPDSERRGACWDPGKSSRPPPARGPENLGGAKLLRAHWKLSLAQDRTIREPALRCFHFLNFKTVGRLWGGRGCPWRQLWRGKLR